MRFSDIYIKLDSISLSVFLPKKDLYIREPALVGRPVGEHAPRFGLEAQRAFALFPDKFRPSRPFSAGMITDYPAAEALMRHVIRVSGALFGPEVTLYLGGCSDFSPYSRLLRNAGASRVNCVGVCEGVRNIMDRELTVDFSERITFLGKSTGAAVSELGLDSLCRLLMRSLRASSRLAVGYAEALRVLECSDAHFEITGRSLDSALPVSVGITSGERDELITPCCLEIISLISDLSGENGVALTGRPPEVFLGLMRQKGLDTGSFISEKDLLSHRPRPILAGAKLKNVQSFGG